MNKNKAVLSLENFPVRGRNTEFELKQWNLGEMSWNTGIRVSNLPPLGIFVERNQNTIHLMQAAMNSTNSTFIDSAVLTDARYNKKGALETKTIYKFADLFLKSAELETRDNTSGFLVIFDFKKVSVTH